MRFETVTELAEVIAPDFILWLQFSVFHDQLVDTIELAA
jgi:hypothetical protein